MKPQRKRIAVIGGGIAGLGAAWALRDTADVTLFEADDRFGGHACTIDLDHGGEPVTVDIGFIVYNRPNYPNLVGLFSALGVETIMTDMSFSVSERGGYEWSSDPWGLFARKRNLLDADFRGLLAEIIRFNDVARRDLAAGGIAETSLGAWLDQYGFSQLFRRAYLLPMSAAIWSGPEDRMLDYPVRSFLMFFENHRLMHLVRPFWRTVKGGSRSYVNAILADLGADRLRPASPVASVHPAPGGRVAVRTRQGLAETFDHAILAGHADNSLTMLDASYQEHRLALGSVRFTSNEVFVHSDPSLMPARRAAWASWNVLKAGAASDDVCVTYWMNRLQKLPGRRPVFVTLNPVHRPDPAKTFQVRTFEHPMYDAASEAARRSIQRLQGANGLHFAGSWLGDGFHEAGLRTGLEAALDLGGAVPWAAVRHRPAASAAGSSAEAAELRAAAG